MKQSAKAIMNFAARFFMRKKRTARSKRQCVLDAEKRRVDRYYEEYMAVESQINQMDADKYDDR